MAITNGTPNGDIRPHEGHGKTFLFTSESVGEGAYCVFL